LRTVKKLFRKELFRKERIQRVAFLKLDGAAYGHLLALLLKEYHRQAGKGRPKYPGNDFTFVYNS